jgi:hypothetical protein
MKQNEGLEYGRELNYDDEKGRHSSVHARTNRKFSDSNCGRQDRRLKLDRSSPGSICPLLHHGGSARSRCPILLSGSQGEEIDVLVAGGVKGENHAYKISGRDKERHRERSVDMIC